LSINDEFSGDNFDTSPFVLRQLTQWVGNIGEVLDDETHPGVKLAVISPSEFRPYITLTTVGLSNFEFHGSNYELSICLPNWWRIEKKGSEWPVEMLKTFYRDAIGSDQSKGCVSGLMRFENRIVWSTLTPFLPLEMRSFQAGDVKITTLGLILLYDDEFILATKIGPDAFSTRLIKSKLTELYNPWRRSVCKLN
jgi:hypothetical protein